MGKHTCACLLFLLTLTVLVRAQEYDPSDDDDGIDPATAVLALRFTKSGGADVSLELPSAPANRSDLLSKLALSLRCPEQRFHSPEANAYPAQILSRLSVEKREQYRREMAEYSQRQLLANCDSVLSWNGIGRDGTLDFSPLVSALNDPQIREFWVSITLPSAREVDYSHENLSSAASTSLHFLLYRIPVQGASGKRVHLSFGAERAFIYRNFAIAVAFVLVPVVITLFMRRTALARGKQDPAAAWFGYFRTLSLVTNGLLLCWVTSGLGARQALQDWSSFVVAPGWRSTLFDGVLVIGPALLVYLACFSLSYLLHLQLRNTKLTRREFTLHQLVTVGERVFPLIFILASVENIGGNANATAAFFLFGMIAWLILRTLRMRVTKSYPHSLTTGELRDRVFALASKAGVSIRQIAVLPSERTQLANAYAGGNRMVMFTDYLLLHLSKREVDAVAAHEIAHLELKHLPKRVWAFYGALMLPGFLGYYLMGLFPKRAVHPVEIYGHLYSAMSWFSHWSQRDFVLILVGLMLFYLLSRRFEFAADARAVALNGDAEAQITGLLKLNRLNLVPLNWTKGAGSFLTHPATLRRTERIAALAGMPNDQYRAILDRHRSQVLSGAQPVEDHYSVPEAAHPENLKSEAIKQRERLLRLSALLLMHVAPPAIVAAFVNLRHVEGTAALLSYTAGMVVTPILYWTVADWLGLAARDTQRRRLLDRFRREGLQVKEDSVVVGFSPSALVRFYGSNYYNWDIGLLELRRNQIVYIGEQIRFRLKPGEIDAVCIGQGGPSWWKFPRVYVRWKQADGAPAVFSIASLEPCPIWEIKKQALRLLQRIEDMRTGLGDAGPSISNLSPPILGDVTSRSPRELGGLKANSNIFLFLLPLAVVANALAHTGALGYIFGTALLTRLIESIPHWRFRDRLLEFNSQADSALAAKSSG